MPDSVTTLRPNSTVSAGGWTTAGASLHAVTSDDDDATWMETAAATATIDFGSFTIPDLATVKSVRMRARAKRATSSTAYLAVRIYDGLTGVSGFQRRIALTDTIVTYTLAAPTSRPGGAGPWDQASIDAVGMRLIVGALGIVVDVYELYLDVTYNQAPAATVTGPSGTIVDTDQPTVTWTYADPEDDDQERYWVKVFDAATYGAAGFDPETATPVWASPGTLSSATSVQVGVALDNGVTYKAYVKVADVGSSGRYGPWDAGSAFTISLDPPNVPVVLAPAGDSDNAWILMGVNAYENQLTDNQATLGTDTSGWVAGTNATIARSTAQAQNGPASLSLTAAAGGDMFANTSPAPVAVVPGQIYAALASFLADSTARDCRVAIRWRDDTTAIISTSNGPLRTDATSGWPGARCVAVAPPTAATAEVIVQVVGAAAAEVHYVDEVAFRPSNDNLLSLNQASLEVDLTGWTAGVNAVLGRSSAAGLVHSGLNSLAVTALAAGNMAARTTGLMAAKPGVAYTVGVWARAVSVARSWNILVRFYDAAGAQIGVDADTVSPNGADLTGAWMQMVFGLGASPAGTYFLSVHIQVLAAGGSGETHVFDDITLSELSNTGVWAPGQVGWSRGGLSGRKIEMQRSDDGGATWKAVRLSVGTSSDGPEKQPFTLNDPGQYRTIVVDHEPPFDTQVLYRARSVGQVGGATMSGPWSYPMPATLVSDVESKWVKDPLDPTVSMKVDVQLPLKYSRRTSTSVTDTLGAELPIPRNDGRKGEKGSIDICTFGQAEADAVDALLGSGRTLLLQLPGGERSRYFVVTSDVATVAAAVPDRVNSWRTTSFDWVEVAAP